MRVPRRSLRSDESGIAPAIIGLIALLFVGSALVVSWLFFAKLFIATLTILIAVGVLALAWKAMDEKVIGERGFYAAIGVAAILVVAGVVVSGVGFLEQTPLGPPADHSTKAHQVGPQDLIDLGIRFQGSFLVGSDREALDAPAYAGAYRQDGSSDKIVWVGDVCVDLFRPDFIIQSRLRVYLTTGTSWGDTWGEYDAGAPSTSSPGCQHFNTVTLTLPGTFPSGWLRTLLVIWTPGATSVCVQGCHVLQDDAEIRSQAGTFVGPPEGKVYTTGEKVAITVHIGNACSWSADPDLSPSRTASEGGGWTLEAVSEAQGRTVAQWDLGCGPSGVLPQDVSKDKAGAPLEYTVTAADFDNSGTVCENTLVLKLYNNLFQKDQRDLKTVSLQLAGQRPPKPTITVSSTDLHAGDALTITVVPDNKSLIKEYSINVAYSDGLQVFNDQHSATSTVTVTLPKSGTLVITASCTSTECAASDPAQLTLTVLEPGQQNIIPPNVPWLFILLLIGIGMALAIGLWLLRREEPTVDDWVWIAAWAVGMVAVAVLLIAVGLAQPWLAPFFLWRRRR